MEPTPPTSGQLGQPSEPTRPPNPEVNQPPVDPIEGATKAFTDGDREAFMDNVFSYSKRNPGIDVGVFGGLMIATSVGRTPEKMQQLLGWVKEASRMEKLGGQEGVAIYNRLREAAIAGNQALYDEARNSKNPNVNKAAGALGKDLLLENLTEGYENFGKFEQPHKIREMLNSIQKPLQPLQQNT